MCMIYSHCPLWANRLSAFSPNQSLIPSISVLFALSIHPSIPPSLQLWPSLSCAHFLWPLNTSLRLLERFLKSQDDFHTSAVTLINYTETGWGRGERERGPLFVSTTKTMGKSWVNPSSVITETEVKILNINEIWHFSKLLQVPEAT